jgi:hypothetical protein
MSTGEAGEAGSITSVPAEAGSMGSIRSVPAEARHGGQAPVLPLSIHQTLQAHIQVFFPRSLAVLCK